MLLISHDSGLFFQNKALKIVFTHAQMLNSLDITKTGRKKIQYSSALNQANATTDASIIFEYIIARDNTDFGPRIHRLETG